MATVLRGKRAGQQVTLHQWCNDWFTINEGPDVIRPTNIKLNSEERLRVFYSIMVGRAGTMGIEFVLDLASGTFRRSTAADRDLLRGDPS